MLYVAEKPEIEGKEFIATLKDATLIDGLPIAKINHTLIKKFAIKLEASTLFFESGLLIIDEYTGKNQKQRVASIMEFATDNDIDVGAIRFLPNQELAEFEQGLSSNEYDKDEPSQAESQKMFDSIIEKAYRMNAQDVHITLSSENNSAFVKYKVENHWSSEVDSLRDYAFGKAIAAAAYDGREGVGQSSGGFDESTTPQETSIEHTIYQSGISIEKISIRYSKSRTAKVGELLVALRLSPESNIKNLHSLNMPVEIESKLRQQLRRSKGAIITSGPTGSGKSTTLFAALLAYPSTKSIQTFEDPIEIRVPHHKHHIVQNSIDKILGYKNQLSAILRQAPDGIYITETRDKDTAEFVFHVAKSGHFVMTSTHANSAMGIIPRMKDYGISGFDLASDGAVELLLSQRLVRTLCKHCSLTPEQYKAKYVEEFALEQREFTEHIKSIKAPKRINHDGCANCNGGEKGRKLVIEMIDVGSKDREYILNDDLTGWSKYLIEQGMITISHQIIEAVESGEVDISRAAEHVST